MNISQYFDDGRSDALTDNSNYDHHGVYTVSGDKYIFKIDPTCKKGIKKECRIVYATKLENELSVDGLTNVGLACENQSSFTLS